MVGICKDEDLNQYISFHPIHVSVCIFIVDQGSIRSSLRNGLSTPNRLIKEQSLTLPLCPFIHIGDLRLFLPALNLSVPVADILIMVQQIRLMMFSWNMVDYHMSFPSLST